MQTLFDQNVHQEVLTRIYALNENSRPQWGKMNIGQMIKHCQLPLLVANGKIELTEKVRFFKKIMLKFSKPIMYNDIAWPKNLSTPKEFKVTDQQIFEVEKDQLILYINEFHHKALNINWPKHPLFGNFSTDQWGRMQYKHLDHHLRQFGV